MDNTQQRGEEKRGIGQEEAKRRWSMHEKSSGSRARLVMGRSL